MKQTVNDKEEDSMTKILHFADGSAALVSTIAMHRRNRRGGVSRKTTDWAAQAGKMILEAAPAVQASPLPSA
jgi:hypothetical protein